MSASFIKGQRVVVRRRSRYGDDPAVAFATTTVTEVSPRHILTEEKLGRYDLSGRRTEGWYEYRLLEPTSELLEIVCRAKTIRQIQQSCITENLEELSTDTLQRILDLIDKVVKC